MKVETRISPKAPAAIGCYCHMAVIGNTGYISGQLPLNPLSMKIEAITATEQAEASLANLLAILEDNNLDKSAVAKTTIFLSDMSNFADVNTVYSNFFGEHRPARSCFSVKGLPMNALVEIEAIVSL
ncbi:RidA family protein [Photobacterium leiognathi]|uniref:RidA family protein n=1 Tax=Photobacterium leiognathi TaxID=553611 RepID=UPI003DA186A2